MSVEPMLRSHLPGDCVLVVSTQMVVANSRA